MRTCDFVDSVNSVHTPAAIGAHTLELASWMVIVLFNRSFDVVVVF